VLNEEKDNNPIQTHPCRKALQLRNNATFSERLLWKHLKRKQIAGYDFDR
jgi:very-short-patch-repair endonuclease